MPFVPKIHFEDNGDKLVVEDGGSITVGGVAIDSSTTAVTGLTATADELNTLAGAVGGATITVGAENTNVRAITIQLEDADGNDLASVQTVMIAVFADAGGLGVVATGGSTGIAIGTDGALLAIVAKKLFLATCEADGDIDLTWTDTGTEAAFLGVILPNGKIVMSAALANT
jgi:hypothetical protein